MSPLPALRASNKAFFASLHTPTAVFVGGTSGIGRAMAEALAAHTEGDANIVIVGRNGKAAQEILASFPSSSAKREFIESDVTKSISGLSSVTAQIAATFPDGIDFLVLTPGYAAMDGRIENEEGIDRKMAVNYYARWKFIYDLAPILREGGKVISVLGAGYGSKIDVEDLGLKKPGAYSVSKVAGVTPTYTDLMMQSFAALYPKHSFTQANPGGVRTNYLSSSPTRLVRWTAPLTYLAYPFMSSPAECAENMWHGIINVAKDGGAYRIGSKGEDLGKKNWYGTEEERKKLWEHTVESVKAS
ncbi:NAD-P-binding protein [Hymenopellis radicata]|nr:NAD-P-binding protein [Hymenopellis radicata]